jgi:hypothetical protein
VGIVEADPSRDVTDVHVVDHWCWIGTARSEDELEDLLAHGLPRFDPDHYQLLTKYLLGPAAPPVREFGPRELREAA